MGISGGTDHGAWAGRVRRVLSGTELLVVILAGGALLVMLVGAVAGVLTRLRRGLVDRGVRSAGAVRRWRRTAARRHR